MIKYAARLLYRVGWCLVEVLRLTCGARWNTPLKDLNPGHDRIVVLANGPSLQDYLMLFPEGEPGVDYMCVNAFSTTAAYAQIKPRFSVFADSGLWTDHCSVRLKVQRASIFQCIAENTNWSHQVIVPASAEMFFKRIFAAHTKFVGVRGFNGMIISGNVPYALRALFYRIGFALPAYHNVVNVALFLAIRLGYKEVVLVGADSTFLESVSVDQKSNAMEVVHRHFYGQNHTKVPFYKDAAETIPMRLHEYLNMVAKMFEGYHEVERYAVSRGVRIVNASKFSWIDAFSRGTL